MGQATPEAGEAPAVLFVQPTPDQIARAARIVDSAPVVSAYAACEWDCLEDDGKVWIAAIVREAARLASPAPSDAGARGVVGEVGEREPAPWAVAAVRAASDAYAMHMGEPDGRDDFDAANRAAAFAIEDAALAALPPATGAGEVCVPVEKLREWYTGAWAMFVALHDDDRMDMLTPPALVEMEFALTAAPPPEPRDPAGVSTAECD